MNLIIEHPDPADIETLVAVQIRAFHDDARLYPGVEIGGPPGYDSVDELRSDLSKYDGYKIVYDGVIVGGMIIIDRGEGHFHLGSLYIDPDYHNRGIGSQAIQFIETTYPATKWTLNTPLYSVRNHHFYEKFGYVNVGEKPEDDIILICYEKVI